MDFEEIGTIEDLEKISGESLWQNFERLTGFIFEKNDFRVKVNTVKTRDKKRRQYDVIAWKGDQTFLVECKKWAGSRYRLSALKRAILQHRERTAFYECITDENTVPVIVTLIEEEILIFEGVPIVPVLKLDSFIRELDTRAEGNSYDIFEDDRLSDDEMPDEPDEFFAEDKTGQQKSPIIKSSSG